MTVFFSIVGVCPCTNEEGKVNNVEEKVKNRK